MTYTLSIIVPVYNEERRLPNTLNKLLDFARSTPENVEVLVVDDGSQDQTRDLVREAMPGYDGLRLIENPHSGKAYTILTGMREAQGTYTLWVDADLSTPPDEFHKLLDEVKAGHEIAMGWRVERHGAPWYRLLMSWGWRTLVNLLLIPNVHDTQCGFKAFSTEAVQHILPHVQLYNSPEDSLSGPRLTAASDVEILFIARKLGYSIKEVEIFWHYDENTKLRAVWDSLWAFVDLLKIRYYDLRGRYRITPGS